MLGMKLLGTLFTEQRVATYSEPVRSLAASLLVLEDWDNVWEDSGGRPRCWDRHKLQHKRFNLTLRYKMESEYNAAKETISTFTVKEDWMTPDEQEFISGVLAQRFVLQKKAADEIRRKLNEAERAKFYVLVNQQASA